MGGISEGGARVTGDDILQFSGNLSLENRGGFASIRSEAKELGLQDGGALVVRVRGDGRQYYLNLHVPTRHMAFSYRAPIDTVANQWQEIRIPLSEFYGTSFGKRVPNAELDPAAVNSLGFLLADKQAGLFNLDIDWIKAE
jgi:monofunctional biosynthetic peptidoglycan transglycosylase